MAAGVGGAPDAVALTMVRLIYGVLTALLVPLVWLRVHWRARREPLYAAAIGERFGRYRGPRTQGWVWVHAVSLGETRAAAALIEALRETDPAMRLLLTHGTATGCEAGAALLREGDRQCWLPWDSAGATRRFFTHYRPRIGVLMETEIWPNLLNCAHAAGVPMVLANARLSERSLRRGARVPWLMRPAVQSFALVLAQTESDAQRLTEAGASRVEICGNLKFDMTPAPELLARGRVWRDAVGRRIVLASSTRDGEESELLEAWRAIEGVRPLLLIVPRHPQRFDAVAALVHGAGFTLTRRSTWPGVPERDALDADVWLGDSMGELPLYYACSQIALLGGSFLPFGGQNLIEAAACGCPVLMGPHTFNFTQAAQMAEAAGAARRVDTLRAAVTIACEPLAADVQRAVIQRCLDFAAAHRGAARQMATRIAALLDAAPLARAA